MKDHQTEPRKFMKHHKEPIRAGETLSPKKPASHSYKLKVPGMIQLAVAVLIFVLQCVLLVLISMKMAKISSFYLLTGIQIAGLLLVIYINQRPRNVSYAQAWTIVILLFPILGILLYLFWGREGRFPEKLARKNEAFQRLLPFFPDNQKLLSSLPERCLKAGDCLQLHYLSGHHFPIYRGGKGQYFPNGESQFEQMFQDIEKAEHYIFIEYFIIADGIIWNKMERLLIQKAREGVEIRLFYDDCGSIMKAPTDLIQRLSASGIQVVNFNPVHRYLSRLYVNYRLHQKVCVVDGTVCWVGGANLADEYANIIERYGYWKDTALRFEGDIAGGCALGFLLLWEMERGKGEEDYSRFFPVKEGDAPEEADGDVIHVPFWDGPLLFEDNPAKAIHHSLITTATKTLYISSPYVLLDDQLMRDICRAAESGVDVRLLIPGIPDKKNVYILTTAGFGPLLKSGVRVFSYNPGFIHAKSICADGGRAILGSINLDFRSFYLNYENAIYVSDPELVQSMEADFLKTLEDCREISYKEWQKRPITHKFMEIFLKMIMPLM